MNKIVTIGRQFGSGGRELGRKIAEKLGWEFYDKEIISEISKRTAFSEEYIHEVVENNPHELFPITVGHTFTFIDTYTLQRKQAVFSEQENVIKEMAEKSNCVIVGRCSDYILRKSNPLRLFVYSDIESKVKRCREREDVEHLPEKKLIKIIKRIDKNRARYYEFYTGGIWGDKLNYDMMVNTSNVDLEVLADSVCKLLK